MILSQPAIHRFISLLFFMQGVLLVRVSSCTVSSDGTEGCDEVIAGKEEQKSTCTLEKFFLNPEQTTPEIFLRQFKPCGWYKDNCEDKFEEWFKDAGGYNENYNLEPNVDYPGTGKQDLDSGVHLVQFDIGLDKSAYDAYLALKDNPENEGKLLDDIDGSGERYYLNYTNYIKYGNWKTKASFDAATWKFGEECVETFATTGDDWGQVSNFPNKYGCMGTCGPGCAGFGEGRDCMKHDVCSYFKSLALDENSDGFCMDFDCGDEAAQTVVNCWIRRENRFDEAVICDKTLDDNDPNFYGRINPAARVQMQKKACTLRTKWERNQGMPWQRYPDGTRCTSADDCESRRCERKGFTSVCMPRLKIGERCNEHSDCISLKCGSRSRFNPFNWRCLENN